MIFQKVNDSLLYSWFLNESTLKITIDYELSLMVNKMLLKVSKLNFEAKRRTQLWI